MALKVKNCFPVVYWLTVNRLNQQMGFFRLFGTVSWQVYWQIIVHWHVADCQPRVNAVKKKDATKNSTTTKRLISSLLPICPGLLCRCSLDIPGTKLDRKYWWSFSYAWLSRLPFIYRRFPSFCACLEEGSIEENLRWDQRKRIIHK